MTELGSWILLVFAIGVTLWAGAGNDLGGLILGATVLNGSILMRVLDAVQHAERKCGGRK